MVRSQKLNKRHAKTCTPTNASELKLLALSELGWTYLLSSPPLHTCTPVAVKPHMHRFVRLPLTAPSVLTARPPPPPPAMPRRCDSRTTRITCLSFISRVKPTPESHPLECSDGTDVSKLFKFLSKIESWLALTFILDSFISHILILVLQWIVSNASIFVFHQIEIGIEHRLWQWHIDVLAPSSTVPIAVDVWMKKKHRVRYLSILHAVSAVCGSLKLLVDQKKKKKSSWDGNFAIKVRAKHCRYVCVCRYCWVAMQRIRVRAWAICNENDFDLKLTLFFVKQLKPRSVLTVVAFVHCSPSIIHPADEVDSMTLRLLHTLMQRL